MDIANMDYDQMLSLLAEQESESPQPSESDEIPYESNNVPQYYTAEKHFNIQSSPPKPPAQSNGKRVSSNVDFTFTKPSASSIIAPHVEILHIVESFLRLKGEMATRIHALINDNFDLFQSIYNVIVAKASKLHGFTLMGISVIRKILEFAVQMIGTWEVNAPSVSIGVNKVFSALG